MQEALFPIARMFRGPYVKRLSRHILTACRRLRYSTVLLTTAPLRSYGSLFLQVQDGLLAEENEKLPFARHVVCALKQFHFVQRFEIGMLVGAQEVIISDPECQIVVGAVDAVKSVCRSVRSFVCAVEPLDHLLVRTELFGDFIVVGKSDHMGDSELESFTKFVEKLLCGQRVGTVTVCDKTEIFWKFLEMPESHAHGYDAGADAAVVGDPVADDGAFCGIHDEPDVGFDTAYLDVGLIGGKGVPGTVVIVVNEGFDADGGSFAVVGDLLVGDGDVVEVKQRLPCPAEGKT